MGKVPKNRAGAPVPTGQFIPPPLPAPNLAQVNYMRKMVTQTNRTEMRPIGEYGTPSGVTRPSGNESGGSFGENAWGGDDNKLKGKMRYMATAPAPVHTRRRLSGAHTFVATFDGQGKGYQRPTRVYVPNDSGRSAPGPWDKGLSTVVTDSDWRF